MTTGLVKMVLAPSGRWAVLARVDVRSPWVQVESCLGMENAQAYVDDLDAFDTPRLDAIEEMKDEDWNERDKPKGENL